MNWGKDLWVVEHPSAQDAKLAASLLQNMGDLSCLPPTPPPRTVCLAQALGNDLGTHMQGSWEMLGVSCLGLQAPWVSPSTLGLSKGTPPFLHAGPSRSGSSSPCIKLQAGSPNQAPGMDGAVLPLGWQGRAGMLRGPAFHFASSCFSGTSTTWEKKGKTWEKTPCLCQQLKFPPTELRPGGSDCPNIGVSQEDLHYRAKTMLPGGF